MLFASVPAGAAAGPGGWRCPEIEACAQLPALAAGCFGPVVLKKALPSWAQLSTMYY